MTGNGRGEFLKGKRKGAGLTLRDLGKATGISPASLSLIENGGTISADHASRLSVYWDFPMARIFTPSLPTAKGSEDAV